MQIFRWTQTDPLYGKRDAETCNANDDMREETTVLATSILFVTII